MCEIEILFSDEHILVINKPSGLRSITDGYNPNLPHLRDYLEDEYNRLWIVHRLDKDTSGVIILARTTAAHRTLNMQFEARKIVKIYHALIVGTPHWQEMIINHQLRKNGDRKHRTVVDHVKGKPAVTEVQVIHQFKEHSLVCATPRTGYTHQIRAHFAAVEFPILSDPLYSTIGTRTQQPRTHDTLTRLIDRVALHAFMLEFTHPHDGSRLTIQAPYPQDFSSALTYLRKQESGEDTSAL